MWKTKTTTQSTSDLSSNHQTSEINLRTSHLTSCYYIRSGHTDINDPKLLDLWYSLEVAAIELHLCFVIKGNVWWKLIFLAMVIIVQWLC